MINIEELLEQIITLTKDFIELSDLKKDTSLVMEEIGKRLCDLKDESRDLVEGILDVPVILDGELLIHEKSTKRKQYIDKKDPEVKKLDVERHKSGKKEYYFYLDKETYRFDIDEANLMTIVRFINYKNEYPMDKIYSVIKAIKKVLKTSYGYRLTHITTNTTNVDVEKISTGTIFNNTNYSIRSYDLLEKLLLKLKDDYIIRRNTTYSTLDYVIHNVESRWLIINIKTGAADILEDEEIVMAKAAFALRDCFDENNILKNDKSTDEVIEKLQATVINYLERNKH